METNIRQKLIHNNHETDNRDLFLNGMYIKIEVLAGAKHERVLKRTANSFFVSVREKAEQNMANRRVLELVRREFGGQGVMVKIISGHHSSHKIVSVEVTAGNE